METMTIGQVAKATGLGIQTIRFYEDKGLVDEPPRRASGYRAYPAGVVTRLSFIKGAKDLGFSLREIAELLSLRVDPEATCADVKALAEAKIADVDEKLRTLRRIRQGLVEITSACSGAGPTGDCPILGTFAQGTEPAP